MSTAFPKLMPESNWEIKIPKDGGAGGIRTGWNNLAASCVGACQSCHPMRADTHAT